MTRREFGDGARFVTDLLSYMTLGEKLGQLDLFRPGDDPALEQAISAGEVGGVASGAHAARWQGLAVERSRLGIPLLLSCHPTRQSLSPWAVAASWDEGLASALGEESARTATERGCNALLGPRCTTHALRQDDDFEIAACEPHLVARLAGAYCEGAARRDGDRRSGVLAMAKIANGDDSGARLATLALAHGVAADAIESTAIDAGAAARAGFDGLLVAECERLRTRIARQFAGTRARSLIEAVERGLADGDLHEEEIDAAVGGVLRVKHALGLFREPLRTLAAGSGAAQHSCPADRVRATMVLLRNEAGTLPFSPVSDRVLVVGDPNGAAGTCADALGRAGIGHVAAPGLAVRRNGEPWSEPVAGDHFALALTRDAAKRVDFVLVVLEDRHFVGPANGEWRIPGETTMAMLRALAAIGPRMVVLIATAEPVDLADADQYFAAVLQCWTPTDGTAEALGDILSGRESPQGRMPVSAGRFAFGHGLGYGESVFSGFTLEAVGGQVSASVRVRNSGSFASRETVQLYRRQPDDTLRLVDYQTVMLAPGWETTVMFELGLESLGAPGESGRFELAPGAIEICVGKNIRRVLPAEIEISPAVARAIVNRDRGLLRLAG
jgi:beta-glucosidase